MASEETLRQNEATNQILQAIAGLGQEIADLRREMNERFAKIETEIEEIKKSQFSFDIRLERVQAVAYDALKVGHDLRADVKVLNAELRAWTLDVVGIQQNLSLKK